MAQKAVPVVAVVVAHSAASLAEIVVVRKAVLAVVVEAPLAPLAVQEVAVPTNIRSRE